MLNNRRGRMLLLSVVIFAAFCPAILANFSTTDDADMIGILQKMNGYEIGNILVPGSGGGLYYRPVLGISFLIDKYFLRFNPALMHIENILIHLANAVLIYFLALQMLPCEEKDTSRLPLVSALFFGLHPITAESVNWISGRTDALAGTFILLSALFLARFRDSHIRRYFAFSLFAFLLGTLTKEVSVAFLAGFLFILRARQPSGETAASAAARPSSRPFKKGLLYLLTGSGVILLFYLLRSVAFTSNASRIGMTLKFMSNDIPHAIFVFLRAFGFYMKKLFIPWPLNFGILEVDPLYELFAIPLVLLCVYIAGRRTMRSALFMSGVFLISPSFVIAFNQIAWTPYAERYIYLSAAFIIPATVSYLDENLEFPNEAFKKAIVVILLTGIGVSTLQRSFIWQSDFRLYEDTVKKSPNFKEVRITYGCFLIARGDYEGALAQLRKAGEMFSLVYDDRADLNIAEIYCRKGEFGKAMQTNEMILEKSKGKSTAAMENLIQLLERERKQSEGREKKQKLNKRLFEYNLKLYKLRHDPKILYDIGTVAVALGESGKALKFFQQASRNMTDDNEYKKRANEAIAKLLNEPGN